MNDFGNVKSLKKGEEMKHQKFTTGDAEKRDLGFIRSTVNLSVASSPKKISGSSMRAQRGKVAFFSQSFLILSQCSLWLFFNNTIIFMNR